MQATEDNPTRWAVVLTAIGAGVLLGFQVGKAPPLIGAISEELGFSLVQAGFYMSLINGFAVLTGIVAGVVADNAGRRRVMILAALSLIAGNVLGAVAESVPVMFASRFLEAFGFVGAVVSAPGLIVEASRPRDVNTSLTLWSTYMPTGFGLMMALTVWTTAPEDWRAIWWLNAAIAAGYLALFLWIARGVGAPPPQARRLDGLKAVLSRPGPWLLGFCFGMYTVQWFGVLNWLPSMLLAAGVDIDDAGLGVALVVGINAIGCMGAGPVLRAGAPRWLVIAACSLTLGLLTVWIYDQSLPPVLRLVLAGVFSTVGGLIPGAALSGAAVHSPTPKQVGITNGVIVQCTNFGSLLGPPAVAAVAAAAGGDFTAARWLTLGAGIAGAMFALALRGVERRMQTSA
ncbi:MAG: CynX/NimT family MFS transporter [Minwuia sp.]|uniref:MFS transporter n=1 Tax=Minwuia sp. TaxID=2493630 RepID=UPI003A8AC745